ncbi:unnamed protein product [Fusarium graminearum]|nr:unnamed protein product [Fusarium graminearum]
MALHSAAAMVSHPSALRLQRIQSPISYKGPAKSMWFNREGKVEKEVCGSAQLPISGEVIL